MLETALHVVAALLTAVGLSMSLGHALELPGKLRLDEQGYRIVQPIYYPGFTIGSLFGEVGAMIAAFALLATSWDSEALRIPLALAFLALVVMHAVYWVVTHPTNKFWLADVKLSVAGSAFFGEAPERPDQPWKTMRNRWEWSHVARAVLAFAALALLLVALAAR